MRAACVPLLPLPYPSQLGGIRAIVVGGFNEHSAEVHRFVENAATTGASKMAMAGEMAFADARAKLRKEFRQRLSVGAWNDMFTHIFKRVRFINPTPAAEAKLLGEKMARNAKERQDRTGQNKQELKNRQNKQKQTKPYLQNKQLISACGSRAGQRMQEEGKYML